MKRFLFILCLLSLSAYSLYASYFLSNQLGQKKGEASSLGDGEWVLHVNGNTETLYRNGVEFSKKIETPALLTKETSDGEERIYRNSDGNIERRVMTGKDGKEREYNYIYSGSHLTGYNYCEDGVLVEKVEYTTSSSGTLLYYRVKDEGIYISDDYFVYEGGDSIELGAFAFSDDTSSLSTEGGGYVEKKDGIEKEYDSRGRLVREKGESSETTYEYLPDGTLLEKREERGDGIYIVSYTDGAEILSRYTPEGVKISERRLLEDGTTEEKRFVNGEAKYLFIYDIDGRRIKEARAL